MSGNEIDLSHVPADTQKGPAPAASFSATPEALARIIHVAVPVMEMAARLTPTTIDDKLVAFLKVLVEDPLFAKTLFDLLTMFDTPQAALAAMKSMGGAV